MGTLLIAQNETRESGSFMGDQLCSLKAAYLFVEHAPDVDRIIMSVSPKNEMHFLWEKFIQRYNIELIHDNWDAGDWTSRFRAWDTWRTSRTIRDDHGDEIKIDYYRELYLRIHGAQRQTVLCGCERGLGRRNIYQYWWCGQENSPDELPPETDWFDDTLVGHPERHPEYDVWISPHAKTQGNLTFTFEFWTQVVRRLVESGVSVTVGYNGWFCDDLCGHPCFRKVWGGHREWMEEVCRHRLVACGNTGTGWLAAACGVPMITMEPHNSCMPDHRYRQCGLRNIVEVVDGFKLDDLHNDMGAVAEYIARRITEEVRRKVVMTTGCYDILHAGHIRHLQRARAMGTRLIVALNSDASVLSLKGEGRPVNTAEQRKAVLEALRCVDEVRVFDGPNAVGLIKEIKPDVLVCGYGYTPDTIVGKEIVEGYGGEVAVSCTGDGRDEPSTTKIIQRNRQADIWQAVQAGAPHSVNPIEKLRLVAEELISVAHLEGGIADMGTYRGGTALIMRRLMPNKHLHAFDTWTGNPYDDPLCHHKRGEWAASLDDCKLLVGRNKLTHYHQGVFPDWDGDDVNDDDYRPAREHQFCFVYVDMDTYQATRDVLKLFWPILVRGGKIVVDDYGWHACAGVKKAVDEMFPPEECERHAKFLPGIARRRVVESRYTVILEKT